MDSEITCRRFLSTGWYHGGMVGPSRQADRQKEDPEQDKEFVAERKLAEGADEVFFKGDSFIPNARALEAVFKARMFAGMEA